jgi:hypothetical protein
MATLGLSASELAQLSGVSEARIRAILASPARVPNRLAWTLHLAMAERSDGEADGTSYPGASCPWVEQWTLAHAAGQAALKDLDSLLQHERECPLCRERNEWVEAHPNPLERFLPLEQRGYDRFLGWLPILLLLGAFFTGVWLEANGGPSWSRMAGIFGGFALFFLCHKAVERGYFG